MVERKRFRNIPGLPSLPLKLRQIQFCCLGIDVRIMHRSCSF